MYSALGLLKSQGFATIPDLLRPEEIDSITAALSKTDLPRSRAGVRHAMKSPVVAAVAQNSRLREFAEAVLGSSAIPYRATLFDKSWESNWLVVWHQDTALPLQNRRERSGWGPWSVKDGILYAHAPASVLSHVLALRLHLDESTETNGPLRVLPGTHLGGVFTDDDIHALTDKISAVSCTVRRGGVLAMRPLLVHASSKSQSRIPRRVLHIEYAARPVMDGLRLAVA